LPAKIERILYCNSQEQKDEAADIIRNLDRPHNIYLEPIMEGKELEQWLKEKRVSIEEFIKD